MTSVKFAISALVLILAASFYPGWVYKWYNFFWFDTVLHVLGGFFIAMLVFSYYNSEFIKVSRRIQFISVVSIATAVGVVWEFTEYLSTILLTDYLENLLNMRVYLMGDLDDTIKDLFMDMFGAITYMTIYLINSKARK